MASAYLDTSLLIRINFEDVAGVHRKKLRRYDAIFSSDLLIAELFAYGRRENLALDLLSPQLKAITLILPDRSLQPEIERVIQAGYARGSDLWHLACACYLAPNPADLDFLTADEHQQEIARTLGFKTPK